MIGGQWHGERERFVGGGGGGGGRIYVCVTEKEREGQQEKGSAVYVWTCLRATGWEIVSGLTVIMLHGLGEKTL